MLFEALGSELAEGIVWVDAAKLEHAATLLQAIMKEIAEAYLSLGGYLSAGGLITRKPHPRALSVFQSIPTSRLLLETDAPDLPIAGERQGSPAHLPMIGRALARDLGLSESVLHRLSTQNAQCLFGCDFARLG